PNTSSVFAERVMGGNYIEFNINRDEIARYGLRLADVQEVLEVALGGMPLTTTVEGLERYSVSLRYDRDFRENLEALREIAVPTPSGAQVALHAVSEARTEGKIRLPECYNIFWSGQYEYMQRAQQRLLMVVPLTLLI